MRSSASPPDGSAGLDAWLRWQQDLHPAEIELGLDRIRAVLERLPPIPDVPVFTVAGTNGKGSCAGLIAEILHRSGHRPGLYTSPHLLHYTERVRIAGEPVAEDVLCAAFARVEAARGEIPLTYFEFGTLAAFCVFGQAGCGALVLEVGLGGRLDAVNVMDADVAVVTSIGLDHQDWLGGDRDSIGREKAGVFRRGRPAICADPDPPAGLVDAAAELGAGLRLLGRDFSYRVTGERWEHRDEMGQRTDLPPPRMAGPAQFRNASAALTALDLSPLAPPDRGAIEGALLEHVLPGRFQRIRDQGFEWVLDVAHNPDAAAGLAGLSRSQPVAGRTLAVLGMLADKDAAGVVAALAGEVDAWFTTSLDGERGRRAEGLAATVRDRVGGADLVVAGSVDEGMEMARRQAGEGDRILVLGSFFTVADALRHLGARGMDTGM